MNNRFWICASILVCYLFSFPILCAVAHEFQWATRAGGSGSDYANSITVDSNRNSYIIGEFEGTVYFGDYELISGGLSDVYIAKLDPYGNYLWAIRAGGSSNARGYGIAIGNDGFCYVTGSFVGTASFGASLSKTSAGGADIFVAKLDLSGNWLWVDSFGYTQHDTGYDIAVDNSGNCYVTGNFRSVGSNRDMVFIGKWNSSGTRQWWNQGYPSLSSANASRGTSIAVSPTGDTWITGWFLGNIQFGSSPNSVSLSGSGSDDFFVAKLNTFGTWIWARGAGGSARDQGHGISIDAAGNSYATGWFASSPASFGASISLNSSDGQVFVAKLNTDGVWQWVTQAGDRGSTPVEGGMDIVADGTGNSYVTGYFKGFGYFGELLVQSSSNSVDIFIASIDSAGDWQWLQRAGGASEERGNGIALDNATNCYITGNFSGASSHFGTTQLSSSGATDVFVTMLKKPMSELNSPQELSIEIIGEYLVVSWDLDATADSYRVEASLLPYSGFADASSQGDFDTVAERVAWQSPLSSNPERRFFRVISVRD